MKLDNYNRFAQTLEGCYIVLFADDPTYRAVASKMTPAELARKMTNGLGNGSANINGSGIKQTCKTLGIPYTYRGIRQYLGTSPAEA